MIHRMAIPEENTILVTIGITSFNAKDTIERAVKSAVKQDWKNIEIIIADDCSNDGTVELIEKIILPIDTRITLLKSKNNLGAAGTRNAILKHTNGEYLVFFDDDDESDPERITEQVRVLNNYEIQTGAQYVACYASGIRFYPNGYTLSMSAIGSQEIAPNGHGLANYLLFYQKNKGWFYGGGVPACSLLARKITYEAVGGFDANLRRVEDADFAIRLSMINGHFIGTRKYLFKQYATQASDKTPEMNLAAELQLVENNKQYLLTIGKYDYAYRWPKLRYWHFKKDYLFFIRDLIVLFVKHPYSVAVHLSATGPKRLIHEYRMRKNKYLKN